MPPSKTLLTQKRDARSYVPCLGIEEGLRRGCGERARLKVALNAVAALSVLLGDLRVDALPRYIWRTTPPCCGCCNELSNADLWWAAACTCAWSIISWLIWLIGLVTWCCTPAPSKQQYVKDIDGIIIYDIYFVQHYIQLISHCFTIINLVHQNSTIKYSRALL